MRARALVVRSGVGVCGAPHQGWEGRCSVGKGQGGACRVPLGLPTVGACVAGAAPTVDNPGARRISLVRRLWMRRQLDVGGGRSAEQLQRLECEVVGDEVRQHLSHEATAVSWIGPR
jgi:hypothetical protein